MGMCIIGIPPIMCSHIINWWSTMCAWSIIVIMFTAAHRPSRVAGPRTSTHAHVPSSSSVRPIHTAVQP